MPNQVLLAAELWTLSRTAWTNTGHKIPQLSELTGSNHRCRAQFKYVQTVVGQRFAGNGPNGLSYYYYYYYYCYGTTTNVPVSNTVYRGGHSTQESEPAWNTLQIGTFYTLILLTLMDELQLHEFPVEYQPRHLLYQRNLSSQDRVCYLQCEWYSEPTGHNPTDCKNQNYHALIDQKERQTPTTQSDEHNSHHQQRQRLLYHQLTEPESLSHGDNDKVIHRALVYGKSHKHNNYL